MQILLEALLFFNKTNVLGSKRRLGSRRSYWKERKKQSFWKSFQNIQTHAMYRQNYEAFVRVNDTY